MERLKQSSYTAKTDHLRRLLDRTRKAGAFSKTRRTWLDFFHVLGQFLWSLGILGQLLWNLAGIAGSLLRYLLSTSTPNLPPPGPFIELESSDAPPSPSRASWVWDILEFLDNDGTSIWSPGYYGVTVHNMVKWSLLFNLVAFWWNPKFKEGYRGYHRHIRGFYDWYKYQALLSIARVLFWFLISYGSPDRIDQSATLGLHIFELVFIIWVCIFGPQTQPSDY